MDRDLTILDCEIEVIKEWYNEMQEMPTQGPDLYFDDFGNYRHTHKVANAIIPDNRMKAYEQSVKP